ncbi:MAG: hypothetical protein RR320_05580, partial [Oscillospiraceae bacterium]
MKKLLAIAMAVAMALSLATVSMAADKWEDTHSYRDFFSIKETKDSLVPGHTYYFETDWNGDPIDDEFFKVYGVTVSVSSNDDSLSGMAARSRLESCEFVKGTNGKYYFTVRAKSNKGYKTDADLAVRVYAKDRSDADYRGLYEMYLTIDYSRNETPSEEDAIYENAHDVSANDGILLFDNALDSCRLNFDDGSYYNLVLGKGRKFGLGYLEEPNGAIVGANPTAKLKFLNFVYAPKFDKVSVMKVHAPGMKFLYQIGDGNKLTLLSDQLNDGYFGFTTAQLGEYVASDRALAAAGTTAAPSAPGGGSTGSTGAGSSLYGVITANFSNRVAVISYGNAYEPIGSTQTLKATGVNLSGFNSKITIYAYDEINNKLYPLTGADAVVNAKDGALYFKTSVKGQYV